MTNLKGLEEIKNLALEDYERIRDKFIKDAEANYEVYKQDLMYLTALDILKSSEFVISSLTKYYLSALRTQNDITLDEIEKVSEMAIKYNKEISNKLNEVYKNSTKLDAPQNLKEHVDGLIRSLRSFNTKK